MIASLDLLATLCLMQSKVLLAFLAARAFESTENMLLLGMIGNKIPRSGSANIRHVVNKQHFGLDVTIKQSSREGTCFLFQPTSMEILLIYSQFLTYNQAQPEFLEVQQTSISKEVHIHSCTSKASYCLLLVETEKLRECYPVVFTYTPSVTTFLKFWVFFNVY